MKIVLSSRRLKKALNSKDALTQAYGDRMAKRIKMRLAVLEAAKTLDCVLTHPPERLHQLRGDRIGEFAVDLVHPYRLILEPTHHPVPRREDGGIDRTRVMAITILGITDYH